MTLFWLSLFPSAIRLSTPLTLAALGGYFSERAGVISLGLEGMMLMGAFSGAAANYYFQSPLAGYAFAILAGVSLASIHALVSVYFRANQVVSGMAINILAFGTAPLLSYAMFNSSGTTPTIEPSVHAPDIGPFTPLVFISIAAVFLIHYWTYKTPWGLRFRAIGDHPEAADSLGINVNTTRMLSVITCGVLCGLAGAFLSIEHGAAFSRNMSAGRGYLALTALIFGQWRPIPTFLSCLLFGFTDALQIRLQGAELPGLGSIPPQFIQIIPYVTAMVVLATFIGKATQPEALGKPYFRQE